MNNKICLKKIDHGSRSTWGPGPSGSRFRTQKYDLPELKQTFPTTFVLLIFFLVSLALVLLLLLALVLALALTLDCNRESHWRLN